MLAKFFLIFFLQLNCFQTSFCVYYGHEVGGTSMDSTHYDRRMFERQCPVNNSMKEQRQVIYWSNVAESSSSNNSNGSYLKPIQRQFKINRGDNQLVTRVSSDAVHVNNTDLLDIDQASVNITVDQQISGNLTVSIQVIECIDCFYEIIAQNLSSNRSLHLILNSRYTYRIRIELTNTSFCLENVSVHEHGEYILNVQTTPTNSSVNSNLKCSLTTQRSANNIYIPLIIAGIILLVLFIASVVGQRIKLLEYLVKLKNRCFQNVPAQESTHSYDLQRSTPAVTVEPTNRTDENTPIAKLPPIQKTLNVMVPRSKRLLSLDAFRGFTLVAMIFVNYGGGGYAQFDHAPWHGITFADIVFPFFVWMLGTSMVFSLKNGIDKGISKRILLKKVAIRTIKLFLIGFILNTRFKVDLSVVRILGVLQRFAIVYGVVATIEVLCTKPRQYSATTDAEPATAKAGLVPRLRILFCDIISFPLQWLIMIGLVTIWVLIVYLVPFEGCPAGYLGPGGLHMNGLYENCTGGITGYIDRIIFTEKHLYTYPTCQPLYDCKPPYDPENLLGAIPTMFLAFLGVQAGRILAMYQTDIGRLVRLFTWSIVSIAIGVGLTAGTLDGGPMPLNKNIWTLSFSFFTAGLAFAGFALMYILTDMLKWWNGTPFQYIGSNSILIYITHLIFATYFPVQWVVPNTHAAHLAMALWGCVFWNIIAYILFKKRIFLVL